MMEEALNTYEEGWGKEQPTLVLADKMLPNLLEELEAELSAQ